MFVAGKILVHQYFRDYALDKMINSLCVIIGLSLVAQFACSDELTVHIDAGLDKTNHQLKLIADEWQIEKYPKFLKSAQMHKSTWLDMKIKFMKAIVAADISHQKKEAIAGLSDKFIISFTGSSVAAGHDSHFDQSYPIVAGNWMEPAFSAVGVNLTVRNVAMGNNPCMPYGMCGF